MWLEYGDYERDMEKILNRELLNDFSSDEKTEAFLNGQLESLIEEEEFAWEEVRKERANELKMVFSCLKVDPEKSREYRKRWQQSERGREIMRNAYLKRRSYKHKVHFTPVQRRKLLDRDNWTCQLCGKWVHDVNTGNWNNEHKAHVDHIVPISKGGNSEIANLQILCRTCNLSKCDKIIDKGKLGGELNEKI